MMRKGLGFPNTFDSNEGNPQEFLAKLFFLAQLARPAYSAHPTPRPTAPTPPHPHPPHAIFKDCVSTGRNDAIFDSCMQSLEVAV